MNVNDYYDMHDAEADEMSAQGKKSCEACAKWFDEKELHELEDCFFCSDCLMDEAVEDMNVLGDEWPPLPTEEELYEMEAS